MASDEKEMTIKISNMDPKKRFSLFKFNESLNTDVTNWARDDTTVTLVREDNAVIYENTELEQAFGAGSEFGRAQRHLARQKKYGRRHREYKIDDQSWLLNVEGRAENRRYRGMREGGAAEYADYWVFRKQNDGTMEAIKLSDWYHYLPIPKYKPLDAEQAEEEFLRRNQVVNQFALKAQLKRKADAEDEAAGRDGPSTLKISDRDEYKSDSDDVDGEADDTGAASSKSAKKKRKAKQEAEDRDPNEVARVESDDGDEEGQEQDYMSDSGSGESDAELETKPNAANNSSVDANAEAEGEREEELGVADQATSDEDDSDDEMENVDDEDSKGATEAKADANGNGASEAYKKRMGADADEKPSDDSEDSDSDDPDKEVKSAFFLQKKNIDEASNSSNKRPSSRGSNSGGTPAKRQKTQSPLTVAAEPSSSAGGNGDKSTSITESEVRRHLLRRPYNTKQLLNKFNKTCNMSKEDLVAKLADILKKIQPKQTKQKVDGKTVLFFSLDS